MLLLWSNETSFSIPDSIILRCKDSGIEIQGKVMTTGAKLT